MKKIIKNVIISFLRFDIFFEKMKININPTIQKNKLKNMPWLKKIEEKKENKQAKVIPNIP